MEYEENDFLMLSGIQHFMFCPRQWALIHIEQQWADNVRTVEGNILHEKAHDATSVEKRSNVIITRGMAIQSRRLGISGACDVVEFHRSQNGIPIPRFDGTFSVVPIEYKRGEPKEGKEDLLQLTAQAVCLEEMLSAKIEYGYLYYAKIKRRTKVLFEDDLRGLLSDICSEMHAYYSRAYTPKVKIFKRCNACSLKNLCMPVLCKNISAKSYIKNQLKDDLL